MKKLTAFALVLTLVLSLAACGYRNITNSLKPALTLEIVSELAKKGDSLTWKDFENYADGGDTGSGLYILTYPINDEYQLSISGAPLDEPPMNIRLYNTKTEESIDIRYEDVDSFIAALD